MILSRILEHDLHRSRQGDASPLWMEVPVLNSFLPILVSGSRGQFIVVRKLLKQEGEQGYVRVGVFPWDSDRLDDLINDMCISAKDMSTLEGWGNCFSGRGSVRSAFNYVRDSAGIPGQPHVCLYPEKWEYNDMKRVFGAKNLDVNHRIYRKYCSLRRCKIDFPTFLSRPDFVGMYTQFMTGTSSIILHNIKLGMGFCL